MHRLAIPETCRQICDGVGGCCGPVRKYACEDNENQYGCRRCPFATPIGHHGSPCGKRADPRSHGTVRQCFEDAISAGSRTSVDLGKVSGQQAVFMFQRPGVSPAVCTHVKVILKRSLLRLRKSA